MREIYRTTWTQEMIWLISNNLDFKGAEVNLGERYPFLDYTILFDYRTLMKSREDFRPPLFLTDSVKFVGEQKKTRFIKTHLAWCLLPKKIQQYEIRPKIVYVARNPKDTCVSYFHHCKLIEGYTGSFDDFSELFLAGKLCFAPYWQNVLSFWERRHQPNILFLKYETLKSDLPSVIQQVANFLGKNLTTQQVEILTKHLSFESMKNNKAVNYDGIIELNKKYKLIELDGSFMRSGKTGDYRTAMSPEMIQRFDRWTEENSVGTGLSF